MGTTSEASNVAVSRTLEIYLGLAAFPDWHDVKIARMTRLVGGLSWETFAVDLCERTGERSERVVVKRAPAGGPLAPYDVGREASLLEALPAFGVPVAPLLACTRDTDIFERPFFVMGHVDGESPDLRKIDDWPLWQDEASRSRIADQVVAALAAIQRFDWRPSPLAAGGGGGEARLRASVDHYFGKVERYVHSRWPYQVMTHHVALWLKENAPACRTEELVLVHGDFRFGNWIFQGEKLAAVLDWERAAVGDPMQDLGFLCMPLARQRRPDLMGMLLPLDELSTRYHAATGREIDRKRLHYWVIYWQFVEAALVARALAFAIETAEAGVHELRSVTAYPQLATNTRQLAQLIDDYEAGRHDL